VPVPVASIVVASAFVASGIGAFYLALRAAQRSSTGSPTAPPVSSRARQSA
jgi:hypothetical protein